MGGVFTQQSQGLLGQSTPTKVLINDYPHLGTMVGWAEVKKVNGTYHHTACLNH